MMTRRRSKRMGIEKFGNVMNLGGGSIIILSIIEAAHWEAFCIALLFSLVATSLQDTSVCIAAHGLATHFFLESLAFFLLLEPDRQAWIRVFLRMGPWSSLAALFWFFASTYLPTP
jgi:hypothetical protein